MITTNGVRGRLLAVSVGLLLATVVPRAGAATVTWDGSTDMNWDQPDSTSWGASTYNSGDTVSFAGAGLGTVVVRSAGVTPGAMTTSHGAGTYEFTNGPISGNFYLDMNGAGTVRMDGTNRFAGTYHSDSVSVRAFANATLQIGNANAVGGGAILCSGYSTLTVKNISGAPLVLTNRFGGDWFLNFGRGAADGSDIEFQGSITVPGGGAPAFDIAANGVNQTVTFSGPITCGLNISGANGGLVKITSTNTPGITSDGIRLNAGGNSWSRATLRREA